MGKIFKNKLFVILLVNFLLLTFLAVSLDIVYYVKAIIQDMPEKTPLKVCMRDLPFCAKMMSFDKYYQKRRSTMFRPIAGKEYTDKVPIVLFGCSFAYGHTLPDEKILSALLADKMKRTVYNFGFPGWGGETVLYLLKNDKELRNIKKEGNGKQYLIYWYITDHLRRLYSPYWMTAQYYFLTYTEKNNDLYVTKHKHPVLDAYYPYKIYNTNRIDINADEHTPMEEKLRFFNLHLKKIMEEKQKVFPDAEFILLSSADKFPAEEEKIMKDMGIRILYIKEMTGIDVDGPSLESETEWLAEGHPNENAVKIIAEALAKELKE